MTEQRMPAAFLGHGNPMNAHRQQPLTSSMSRCRHTYGGSGIARLVEAELIALDVLHHEARFVFFIGLQ